MTFLTGTTSAVGTCRYVCVKQLKVFLTVAGYYEPFLSAPSAMRNADLLNSTKQEKKNTVTRQHTHGNWIVSCADTDIPYIFLVRMAQTSCPCKDVCRLYKRLCTIV